MATFTATIQELLNEQFDFGLTAEDYPIYKEQLRGTLDSEGVWQNTIVATPEGGQDFYGLNKMILDHYMYYEIGQETPDMFRFMLNRKLREVMPYYNQLLATEAMVYDPWQTVNTTSDSVAREDSVEADHSNTDSTGTTNTDAKSRSVSSMFPQTVLAGNEDYATSATDVNSQSEAASVSNAVGDSTKSVGTDGNNTSHVTGSHGHTAALLMQYRRSFLNITMMIVNDIAPLFMMVTDNLDDSFERNNSYGFGLAHGYFRAGF